MFGLWSEPRGRRFRSSAHADAFLVVRSYPQTGAKHARNQSGAAHRLAERQGLDTDHGRRRHRLSSYLA